MSEMWVTKRDGSREKLEISKIHKAAEWACRGLKASLSDLETSARIQFVDGMTTESVQDALIKSAAEKISIEEQDWKYVAARLLLQKIYKHANEGSIDYPNLRKNLTELVEIEKVDARLIDESLFDLDAINAAIDKNRDLLFAYMGLQTLYDRYLIRDRKNAVRELPQHLFARVAMGVALAEETREARTKWAIEFYHVLSQFKAMASTPTLFNSGTRYPQLSSCFLLSMSDSLDGIMDTFKEAASYSKFSGGIGLDMGGVRSAGTHIKSTGGKAGGVIPYAKIYNDLLLGFDQGGKRLGAGALYIEPWHADIEEFLDLKNNTGDERRRAHDIFPALWLNDLFMERVLAKAEWSLFSPAEVPELHDAYGEKFRQIYEQAEADGRAVRKVEAHALWRKMIGRLFETGTYWPCFKDASNERYPQKGTGVVHSSNLCTEILLRTNENVSAVCNLSSINLSRVDWNDKADLDHTVRTMIRFLDNVITIGLIPHEKGRRFNLEDRAVGLGVMGYAEFLVKNGIDFESRQHLAMASRLMERISASAVDASAELAREKGSYPMFAESEWAKGVVPIDTAKISAIEKLGLRDVVGKEADWGALREKVKGGMRNSCLLAIAPTATISNITDTNPCTELPFQLAYRKGNLSGSFEVIAPTLQYGRPDLCKTAYDVDQLWTVRAAAARQLWIDQSQSTNIFVYEDVSGPELSRIYTTAWDLGLKTTYYLRSKAPELRQEAPDAGCESCQ
jgi:ribonucleoside-diphosphate reductase alpha chain